jgi:hypothetical protein
MMKVINFILTLALLAITQNVFAFELKKARDLFNQSLFDKNKAEEFAAYMQSNNLSAIAIGYKGASSMMLSKYGINPFSKLKNFNEGKELLETALQKDPTSVELHYLRFSFQTNVPAILNYNNMIENDKAFLIKSLKNISDAELKSSVITVLKNSKYLNAHEKQSL